MRSNLLLSLALLPFIGCGSSQPSDVSTTQSQSPPVAPPDFDHPPMAPIDADVDDPAALEQALEENPGHSPILMRMAEIARQSGDHEKAVEHLRAAIEAEPDNLDARLELGRALYEAGDIAAATGETETLIERDGDNVDGLYNLGAIHANQGSQEKAIEYWTRAVAAGPSSPSGQNAQRGLDTLTGRITAPRSIPDTPEHRGLTQSGGTQPGGIQPGERDAIIRFAAEATQP